jgi:murein DD-endopeptidase MepM/ murein hydrolase activator NlpD
MRFLLFIVLAMSAIWAGSYKLKYWKVGETFGDYLTRHHIDSTKFYSQIDPDDIKFLSAIMSNSPFFENIKDGKLQEALIPLGEQMQIYISKAKDGYKFDIIPLKYKMIEDTVTIKIENNCFVDIKKATNNAHIATYIKRVFKDKVDFTKLKKGDIVSVKYKQKSIKGLPWEEPIIEAAYIKRGNQEYFAIKQNSEYKIYTNSNTTQTKVVVSNRGAIFKNFTYPLNNIRITSKFTYKRWHPILHRYRPHLGIDFGAKMGTPIYSIASGKVIYAGWMRGYGKVTKIDHGGGIVSLYAHQSKILVKRGEFVKAHQVIGKIGSTGRSTGPHLHLGVYKRGKPINPAKYINHIVKLKDGIRVKKSIKIVNNLAKELPFRAKIVYNSLKKENNNYYRWKNLNSTVKIVIKKREDIHARVKLPNAKGDA